MSIRAEWKKRVREERLFRLRFLIPGPPEIRTVLMSPEVNKLVEGPWPTTLMGDRCARLRENLENILAGKRLVVCWDPFKARERHQIGRLDPLSDHIFDIRCVDKPGLRVIFHFAEKDVLVIHVCSPRSVRVPWLSRVPLLDRFSPEWRDVIAESNKNWSELFSRYSPRKGNNVDDYLSNSFLI
jgi:hypothetical protein